MTTLKDKLEATRTAILFAQCSTDKFDNQSNGKITQLYQQLADIEKEYKNSSEYVEDDIIPETKPKVETFTVRQLDKNGNPLSASYFEWEFLIEKDAIEHVAHYRSGKGRENIRFSINNKEC